MFVEIAIKAILRFIYGFKSEHWKFALDLIRQLAEKKDLTNPQRADTFFAYFKTYYPSIENRAIEKGRDLIRDFAKRKGWIDT